MSRRLQKECIKYLLRLFWLASEHRGHGFALGGISCSGYGVEHI
jgi:hypothetical protein